MRATYFMKRFKKWRFFLCIVCYVVGLTVLIHGFIPGRKTKLQILSVDKLHRNCMEIIKDAIICKKIHNNLPNSKHFKQVVLLVIDALRADFIPSISLNTEFNTSLPYTEALIKNKSALSFINKVHSPTVTMPRIKTLTTGGISNFMDALTNLDATELNEDSFLHQAHLNSLKSVFYGDDTWLKLFPDLFLRSEGTHSFFVSDYQEVDTNVTRHLRPEFSKNDWDIMILHYLGVDHIGHAYGPYSNLLPPKLKEMDSVISFVYNQLKDQSKVQSLIIICGDHGMTSAGSHGGITKSELLTPLIFINTNNNSSQYHSKNSIKTVDQVDFAVTLSSLLGIPIPANSFGNIIPDVLKFSGLVPQQILNAAFCNLLQLFEVYKSVFPTKSASYTDPIKNILKTHSESNHGSNRDWDDDNIFLMKSYMILLTEMKQDLLASVAGYNLFKIILGIIIIWLSLLCTIISFLITEQNNQLYPVLFYYIKSVIFNKFNTIIFPASLLGGVFFTNFSVTLYVISIIYTLVYMLKLVFWILKFLLEQLYLTFMEKVIFSLFAIHTVSLFSSSFVEEEHQTWYFILSTILILYLSKSIFSVFYLKDNHLNEKSLRSSSLWNVMHLNKDSEDVIALLFLLISHRILRNWNQTGDKWQHLPDIFDWLNKEENVTYSSLAVAASLTLTVLYLRTKQSKFTRYSGCLGLFCIYIYKCHEGYSSLFFKRIHLDVIVIPWFIYILVVLIIFSTWQLPSFQMQINDCKTLPINLITAWVLFIQLLGRAYNIPLTTLILIQEHYLHRLLWKTNNIIFNSSCYLLMAMCSFFYQGNSNSLSTIDVFSGYVGLLSYKPVIVGFLITCNTYSYVVLWLILLVYRLLGELKSSVLPKIFLCFLVFVIYKLFVLAVYCIVMYLMKHHLFILSVFAPKLFYEVCHTVLFVIFAFIIYISIMLNSEN